jgi:DNA-binding response OmpR family regulator
LPIRFSCAIFTPRRRNKLDFLQKGLDRQRRQGKMKSAQKTVMIIEDEADAAELFAEMMRVNGYRVVKMFSSAPAIPMLIQEKPDVVILDIMMPDISGLEVLRYMRREPELSSIPVIIVSAKSMPGDIKTGLEAGASKYLTKPVGFQDLKQAVESVLLGA